MLGIWVASFGGALHGPVTTYFQVEVGASTVAGPEGDDFLIAKMRAEALVFLGYHIFRQTLWLLFFFA